MNIGSQDNSVTILIITWAGRDFSLFLNIQNGSAAHPTSYLICTGDFTPVAKIIEA
jgi:hypothetical protein